MHVAGVKSGQFDQMPYLEESPILKKFELE